MRWKLVYLNDHSLGSAWRNAFAGIPDVEIIEADICNVACDAVVSPANSFGFMDGGLDYALSERFGWELQEDLQARIQGRPLGELLVGEAMVIPTQDPLVPWLIAAPTMRVPMRLRQTVNAYLAMKAILAAVQDHALEPAIECVAIPGLGTGCGALAPKTAARQMFVAFEEMSTGGSPYPVDFGEAQKRHIALNPEEIELWDP